MKLGTKLSPETLLSAPRRGSPIPNNSGTLAYYSLIEYNFESSKGLDELYIYNFETGASEKLLDCDDTSNEQWIPDSDNEIIYLKSGDDGAVQVLIADAADPKKEPQVVGDFDYPIDDMKLLKLADGSLAFAVTALIGPDDKPFNSETVDKKSSARIFDSAAIRGGDEYYSDKKYSIWYTRLILKDGKWTFASQDLIKAVDMPDFEAPGIMNGDNDPGSHYDLAEHGIAFTARPIGSIPPHLCNTTKPFYLPLQSYFEPPTEQPISISIPGTGRGSISEDIIISPDGQKIAFTMVEGHDQYNWNLVIAPIPSCKGRLIPGLAEAILNETHEPVNQFSFGSDSKTMIVSSDRHGRSLLSKVYLTEDGEESVAPQVFYHCPGTIDSYTALVADEWDKIIVTSSSMIENNLWQIVSSKDDFEVTSMSSFSENGAKFGYSSQMVTDIWINGHEDVPIHCWVVRPHDFDENRQYPMIFMPHGGPTDYEEDTWSAGASPTFYASQGYICVLPNFSGSITYGLKFSRRGYGEWAGNIYLDCIKVLEHFETVPFINNEKRIIMGGSFGACLISWFMGQEGIKKFCGAVWRSGTYSIPVSSMQMDFFTDGNRDWGGPSGYPWEDLGGQIKCDPAQPERLANWKYAPPTLVIHNDQDYRCPVSDGIATFNTLQAHGVPSRFLNFPDEGHSVSRRENLLVWHQQILSWIERCISGDLKRRSDLGLENLNINN